MDFRREESIIQLIRMPATTVGLHPFEYWNSTEDRRAQRWYVSFCELAAAVLDHAEGLNVLRRDERRQGAARLNWAVTAFYYALVHSARFLVFMSIGDFPKDHGPLQRVFQPSELRPVKTDWLHKFDPSPT
jgi:hypothetical protein